MLESWFQCRGRLIDNEERVYRPKTSRDLVSARVRQRHSGPYCADVVPEIAHQSLELPAAVATLAEDAAVEIARFDAELGAEVAPFASVLLRSESASSSRIENLTSGAKSIALAELGSRDKRNATEIIGNVAATIAALDLADRLDEGAILAMHEALLAHVQPDIAGRWRTEQVWIGGDSFGTHGATFIPPRAATNDRQLVRDLRSIRNDWKGKLTARRGATAWRLADVLLRQPVIDTPAVARELGVTPQNALRAITPLVNAGVLEEFTGFARNRMWQTREVLDALDDFAARVGRREA